MPRLIVDGLNVIGSRPDGWWRDRRGAMRALTVSLADYARRSAESVTVFFDGQPFELADEPVQVVFAPGPRPGSADDAIVSALEREHDPGGVRVVTSDRELAARVTALGAAVIPAARFRRRLDW